MTTIHPADVEYERTHPNVHPDLHRRSSLSTLFAGICERHGERAAITFGTESISYYDLDRSANRIASALAEHGAGPGTIVAICIERSIEMVAAMLAVVKCGAAYLPLDPGYPAARIEDTVADALPIAVLTTHSLEERLRCVPTDCLFVEDLAEERQAPCGFDAPLPCAASDDDPAYVIYTSGSTGRPKGVVVSHRNVARLLSSTERWFNFTPEDVWTMFHSFAFDFSVWEIWGCLLTGGRLVIVPFGLSRSPEEFHTLLITERVTVLNQTPSAFVLLDQVDAERAHWPQPSLALRLVLFGGEALSLASLGGWFSRHGDSRPQMVNMYGITETTVHVTYRRILAEDALNERESLIGEPIPDLRIHLLGEDLRPVRAGAEGEIWVSGAGVALGYLNRPELSADRFCPGPFGTRIYRSGDLARRREDGELVYLGRRDSQVKINGFRIELGEIETAIVTHPAIVQACVVAHTDADGRARLAAYFVAQYGKEPSTREMSEYLATRLPAQMMPAFYQRLAVFPLTPNGKVDRSALPAPHTGSDSKQRKSLATPTTLEERIANIWRVVLKAGNVALDDNFFDVGGTSLLLIAVRTGLQEQLDRQIPVTWMFECTTIQALAKRLSEAVERPAQPAQIGLQPAPSALQENARRQRAAFARARSMRGAQ